MINKKDNYSISNMSDTINLIIDKINLVSDNKIKKGRYSLSKVSDKLNEIIDEVNKLVPDPEPHDGPKDNEIWYTTTDGNIWDPYDGVTEDDIVPYKLISNTYIDGKGVMVFDQPVEYVGGIYDDNDNYVRYPSFHYSSTDEYTILRVILPDCLLLIGLDTFSNCPNLKNIDIPKNVLKIGDFAFMSAGLTCLDLSDTKITEIGINAICCENLTDVILPESLKLVQMDAFAYTTWYDEYLLNYTDEGNVVYIGTTAYDVLDMNKPVTFFKEDTTAISFPQCKLMDQTVPTTTLIIPNSVKYIGDGAFYRANSYLIQFPLPNLIETIYSSGFYGVQTIISLGDALTLPQSLKIVKGLALFNVSSYDSNGNFITNKLILPDNIKLIDGYAFYHAYNSDKGVEYKGVTYYDDNLSLLEQALLNDGVKLSGNINEIFKGRHAG